MENGRSNRIIYAKDFEEARLLVTEVVNQVFDKNFLEIGSDYPTVFLTKIGGQNCLVAVSYKEIENENGKGAILLINIKGE